MVTVYCVVGQDLELFINRRKAIEHMLDESKYYDIDFYDDFSGWVPIQNMDADDLVTLTDDEINLLFDGCCELYTHPLELD